MRPSLLFTSLLFTLAFPACSPTDSGDDDDSASQDIPITLHFRGAVGEEDFACGQSYPGLGVTSSSFLPSDFRLFIHGITLLAADGEEVPMELDQDGVWQVEDVALLDFEDGSSSCSNGTSETHAEVTGVAPSGEYQGVRFLLGVPFSLNHQDSATSPSPLNLSAMFWSWQGGHKFFRLEGTTTGQPEGWVFHLGSTGCSTDPDGNVIDCTEPNRAEIVLNGIDPLSDSIAVDLSGLLATSDLDANMADTMTGCMSDPADADCAPLFSSLGLPFGSEEPGGQSLFRGE